MDTYAAETSSAGGDGRAQLLTTIQRELDKLAMRVETDAVALADFEGRTLATAGGWARSGWTPAPTRGFCRAT